ncbi:MAG: EAL domain-containing protein [Pseudomonadota bacterium]
MAVSSGEETIDLTSHLYEWRETHQLSSDDIVLEAENLSWSKVGDKYSKGYISDAYWYRLTLTNSQSENQLRLLEITYPLLDKIDLYIVSKNLSQSSLNIRPEVIQHYTTGDRRPYSDRPIHGRTFVFPVDLAAEATYQVYFRVQSASSHQVVTRLWSNDAYIKYSNEDATYRAIYYGSQLMLIVFILGLYFLMRERVYLLFSITILGLLTLQAAMHGVLFQYVIPNWPLLHEYIILTSVPFILFMMLWFSSDYLDLKRSHRNWYRTYRVAALIVLLALVSVVVLPYRQATSLGVGLSVPVTLLTLWTGIRLWSQGTKTARIFTISWAALLVGCLVTILNQLGVISITGASQYSIPLGASIQSILMAYALADRFQKDRNEKVKAQEARFDALKKQRDTEREMMRSATRNQLTGLCNRQIFEQVLNNHLTHDNNGSLAIGLWHIEGFNDYHKTLGHESSEKLLQAVAERLNREATDLPSVVRLDREDEITVANIETVTFGCIFKNLCQEDTQSVVQKLADILHEPIEFKGLSIEFSVRSGCAFSEKGMDVSTMQRHAFIAFGHNLPNEQSVTVYHPDMDSYSPRRLTLMTELRHALQKDELDLYFQPQVDLRTNECAGFEALIRWTHPDYGFIPPDEFIPIAEETGVIKEVTDWVIKKAVAFAFELHELNKDVTVSVNISAENLRDSTFAKKVNTLVKAGGVSAGALILEVTETAAMEERDTAIQTLMNLNKDGFKVSIDDFGTGYSSLAYLDELPVHEVKIDRSFILKMQECDQDDTIIRATINMSHELGFKVLAEGVEDEKVIEQLKAKGCDLVQGYFFAKPLPKSDAIAWLFSFDNY